MMTGSYSRKIRSELCRVPILPGMCIWAELLGIAGFSPGENPSGVVDVSMDSALVARRAFRLLRALGLEPQMEVRRSRQRIGFQIRADASPPPVEQAIAECPAGWLRGAFLRHGYMIPPDRASHLEFWLVWPHDARSVETALQGIGLHSGVTPRRGGLTVYIQGRNQLVKLLGAMGAPTAVLEVENIRAMKLMKNQINRLVNSETANLARTVESGIEQARSLEPMRRHPLWHTLPEGLQEVALVRMHHPDWSLREIGRALTPPLSKSAVNHRMRRLLAIANSLPAR